MKLGDKVRVATIRPADRQELAHMVGREGVINGIAPGETFSVSVAFSREHGMGFMESELEVMP